MDPMCDLVEAHGISKPKGEMWSACHHMKLKDAEQRSQQLKKPALLALSFEGKIQLYGSSLC